MSPLRSTTTSTDGGEDRYAKRRRRMVERQLRQRGIADERVLAAMAEAPRERFLPAERRGAAYRDGAVYIGAGPTMPQPLIVGCMTPRPGLCAQERVRAVETG